MRLLSFRAQGRESFGVVTDAGIVDLGARRVTPAKSLLELLAMDALDQAARAAEGVTADHALDAVEYLPPIPRPPKILCVGVNYPERHEEYGDGAPLPPIPASSCARPDRLSGISRRS